MRQAKTIRRSILAISAPGFDTLLLHLRTGGAFYGKRAWLANLVLVALLSGCTQFWANNSRPPPPESMVLIAGGSFKMGTDAATIPTLVARFRFDGWAFYEPELPLHLERVSSFWIDRTEVTNASFARFLEANADWTPEHIPRSFHNGKYLATWHGGKFGEGTENHPVTHVSWYAAMAFCQWKKGRLPTEVEWEYAAKPDRIRGEFPWGDEAPDKSRANYGASGIGGPTVVASYPPNANGLYDMAGNVWEYMLDEWRDDYTRPATQPTYPFSAVQTRRVIRGGSWEGNPVNLRLRFRDSHPPAGAGPHVGFRCVRDTA